ncbi:MAG: type II toxin-antitoxin system YoeB family toxin, partial [Stenotrophomonas sp.]
MILQFSDEAWEDYLQWQKIDRRKTERINCLIKAIMRTP